MSNTTLSLDQIAPVYRPAFASLLESVAFSGRLLPVSGCLLLSASSDGYVLSILVDNTTHIIRDARFEGQPATVNAALLEKLCSLIIGLPVDEAYDHGVIKLEFALRGRYGERPVQGIVLPRNADPMFSLPERLLRDAAGQYFEKAGIKRGDNSYDPGPSEAWRQMPDAERVRRLQEIFAAECSDIPGFDPAMLRITEIEFDVRITIEIDDDALPPKKKPDLMRRLESAVHEHLDPRLELAYMVMKDNNSIRRLK